MRFFALAVALLLAGCGASRPAAPSQARAALPMTLDQLLDKLRNDDPAALMAELSEGMGVAREPVENRHVAGQIDSLATVSYVGLSVTAYEVRDGRTFMGSVRVTDPRYRTASGLGVGASRAGIEAVVGEPDHEIEGEFLYEVGADMAPITLNVVYDAQNRATRLVWIPYLD